MGMTIGLPRETVSGERRVALVPGVLKTLSKKGLGFIVQSGAGEDAYIDDDAFVAAGATVVSRTEALAADIVVCVHPPPIGEIRGNTILAGFLDPLGTPSLAAHLAEHKVTSLAMELVPRISRAQSMDALSAMASLSGYKAMLMAAADLPLFFPLMTTAAGTVRPATVTVLGAGVAGLQAIATARRLGARVWGYDIREAVREEVKSLGAQFVELELDIGDMQDEAGYARALITAKAEQQSTLLVPHLAKSDVIITTAAIPGRAAPMLVSKAAVEAMKSGSIIVDLAAPTGGNCELTEPGETVIRHGVTIMGPMNLPSTMPSVASFLYAKTITSLITEFVEDGQFVPNFEDDIFKGICLTHGGEIVNARAAKLQV